MFDVWPFPFWLGSVFVSARHHIFVIVSGFVSKTCKWTERYLYWFVDTVLSTIFCKTKSWNFVRWFVDTARSDIFCKTKSKKCDQNCSARQLELILSVFSDARLNITVLRLKQVFVFAARLGKDHGYQHPKSKHWHQFIWAKVEEKAIVTISFNSPKREKWRKSLWRNTSPYNSAILLIRNTDKQANKRARSWPTTPWCNAPQFRLWIMRPAKSWNKCGGQLALN